MFFLKLMKFPVLQITALLLIFAFAFIIGACLDDDLGGNANRIFTPKEDDFEIDGLTAVADNTVKTVTITPKEDKSEGKITVYYRGINGTNYSRTTNGPWKIGSYAVTFNVEESDGWNAATGLKAGTLTIGTNLPTKDDFNISGLSAVIGGTIKVIITPKSGKSQGTITTYYEGIDLTYNKSTTAPSVAGTYAVTFDVTASGIYEAAYGLEAGTLTIQSQVLNPETPEANDFIVTGLTATYNGEPKEVSIVAKPDKSQGGITVKYNGNTTPPTNVGTYAVTFDVAEAFGFNATTSSLSAGDLVISPAIPVAADFNITGVPTTAINIGDTFTLSITPKDGKSQGTVTIWYTGTSGTSYNKSETKPAAAGTYAVTFDVAAATNYTEVTGLSAGTFTITQEQGGSDPSTTTNYATTLTWGNSFTPTTLGLQPGNTTAEVRLNWYSSGNASGKVAHVRFIRGTLIAGYELITVTNGTVAASSSGNVYHKATVTGLQPGASYVYAVSNDGSNWSPMYDFKVPAAAGPFKFAVITDPQISATSWDTDNRYNPVAGRLPRYGWEEAMAKIVANNVSFIASAGDQVDNVGGNVETEFLQFFTPEGLRSLPFAPVSGNHDNTTSYNFHYNWNGWTSQGASTSSGRDYYYRYNNILFVVLNTAATITSRSAGVTACNGYKTIIQNAKAAHTGNYDWLIVQHHKSTASVGDHCADNDIQYYVEGGFEKLMSDEGVDFVLAGHDHVYARSYPLQGKDVGFVSVPDTSFPAFDAGFGFSNYPTTAPKATWPNPGKPIYLTFTTSSGLKYYAVSTDPYFPYNNSLYQKNETDYPYLGTVTDASGTSSSLKGSNNYMNGNMPVSNAAFVQPYIPSYTIVDVDGRTITFKTYPIGTKSGQNGSKTPYSYNADVPYDTLTVTK